MAESNLRSRRRSDPATTALFEAARAFHALKPWETATIVQLIRVDIPDLGLAGAGAVVLGYDGASRGFALFPTLAEYDAFLDDPRLLPAGEWLELVFSSGVDTPTVRSGGALNPVLSRVDRHGARRAPSDSDTKIVSAAVSAFAAFFGKHWHLFIPDAVEPICESYYNQDDLEVSFCAPYEAYDEFVVPDNAATPRLSPSTKDATIGRNDPCHCGSGRKYKHCHLHSDQQDVGGRPSKEDDAENRLIDKLVEFAHARFGDRWLQFGGDFLDYEETLQLAVPWSLYGYEVDGHTVLDWYLRERKSMLDKAELEVATAQLSTWLSVWEVVDVVAGESLFLQDLLSGEQRLVRERTASRTLSLRDAVLARVSDHDGTSVISGVHPRPLLPTDAAEVVRIARGRLRLKRAVPPSRLRDGAFGSFLIRNWEDQAEIMDLRMKVPPRMSNTDGDELLLTKDRFKMMAGGEKALMARLGAIEGVVFDESGDAVRNFIVLRSADPDSRGDADTIIGHGWFEGSFLIVGTNSERRADILRSLLTTMCGELLDHVARDHPSMDAQASITQPVESEPIPDDAEALRVIREYKMQQYADWPDQPLPALGGRTPREVVRTAKGRVEVDLLIKTMENFEHRGGGSGGSFDFSGIRRELGLV